MNGQLNVAGVQNSLFDQTELETAARVLYMFYTLPISEQQNNGG
jgi:hypothetical protein